MKDIKHILKIGNKSYGYKISQNKDLETSRIICKSANIDQEFLNEDIVSLINDLPNLIKSEEEFKAQKEQTIRFRISGLEKLKLQKKAEKQGFQNLSAYIRSKVLD